MRALLVHGADVEAEDKYGTVLHHLAERGGIEEISALVKRGASPFRLGKRGLYYRLMPYQLSKNEEVIRFLFREMKFLFSHLTTEDQSSISHIYSTEKTK